MATSYTTVANAFSIFTKKELGKVQLGRKDCKFFNRIRKVKMPAGEGYRIPMWGSGGIVSHTMTSAQTYGADPDVQRFVISSGSLAKFHRILQISNEAIRAGMADPSSFVRESLRGLQDSVEQTVLVMERELLGDGYASIGVCATASTASITLATRGDAKFFRKGMGVVASTTIGGSLMDSGAVAIVSGVNPQTGTITFSANLSTTLASLTTGGYLFPAGSAAAGGTRKGVHGIQWWAETPSGGESFFGLDRSTNTGAYTVQLFTGSSADIRKSIQDADAANYDVNGTMRDWALLNPRDYSTLADQEYVANVRLGEGANKSVGLSKIAINSTSGVIECESSPFIPAGKIALLNASTWELVHLPDEPVNIDDLDGSAAMKLASSAGVEARVEGYVELACPNPGANTWITVA